MIYHVQAKFRDHTAAAFLAKLTDGTIGNQCPDGAELVASMEQLRNFGFRYQDFEVTVALAGIRRALEEIRAVRGQSRKVFDVSIVPQFRLAAKADD